MRRALTTLVIGTMVTGLVGCGDDTPRSDVQIYSVNGNSALQSDVLNLGEDALPGTADDFVPEDEIYVVFGNYPSDTQTPANPTGAFGRVTMTRYRVSFQSEDAIPSYVGGMNAVVAQNDTSGAAIVVVPGAYKVESPLVELNAGGELLSTARLECWGYEQTSGDSIYTRADFVVNFAQFGDSD
jgi:hypothetical protein